jgi:hypothetical protein
MYLPAIVNSIRLLLKGVAEVERRAEPYKSEQDPDGWVTLGQKEVIPPVKAAVGQWAREMKDEWRRSRAIEHRKVHVPAGKHHKLCLQLGGVLLVPFLFPIIARACGLMNHESMQSEGDMLQ